MSTIEKVHGIHATALSMNDRFTLLMKTAISAPMRQRRQGSGSGLRSLNMGYNNRMLIEQVARRLEWQAKRQALRQRLGLQQGGYQRFGNDNNMSGIRRSNSAGNLSQQSIKNRVSWRQSNGNLSRSASFTNLSNMSWRGRAMRGFRRRGGGQRALRGRFSRGAPRGRGRVSRVQQRARPQRQEQRPQVARRGGVRGVRGRGRGGVTRSQSQQRKLLSREELDAQLDQYMACTKSVLDQELDNYMKNAMEME